MQILKTNESRLLYLICSLCTQAMLISQCLERLVEEHLGFGSGNGSTCANENTSVASNGHSNDVKQPSPAASHNGHGPIQKTDTDSARSSPVAGRTARSPELSQVPTLTTPVAGDGPSTPASSKVSNGASAADPLVTGGDGGLSHKTQSERASPSSPPSDGCPDDWNLVSPLIYSNCISTASRPAPAGRDAVDLIVSSQSDTPETASASIIQQEEEDEEVIDRLGEEQQHAAVCSTSTSSFETAGSASQKEDDWRAVNLRLEADRLKRELQTAAIERRPGLALQLPSEQQNHSDSDSAMRRASTSGERSLGECSSSGGRSSSTDASTLEQEQLIAPLRLPPPAATAPSNASSFCLLDEHKRQSPVLHFCSTVLHFC